MPYRLCNKAISRTHHKRRGFLNVSGVLRDLGFDRRADCICLVRFQTKTDGHFDTNRRIYGLREPFNWCVVRR